MRQMLIGSALILAVATAAGAQSTREITYNQRAVIPVNAKLRFTTMIILPEHEQILDFVCGDKDFWVVSGAENLAYVKPAKEGARTNLNLVTASGTVYSFLLTEGAGQPDLKLYVLGDPSATAKGITGQRFYSAAQVDDLRKDADAARRDAESAKVAAANATEAAIGRFRATYPTELRFPYRYKANQKPFNVAAIFHDGRFTYIRADGTELPSLYEVRDGTPNLVNFQVERGTYIVPKVLERGYLTVGSQRFTFESIP